MIDSGWADFDSSDILSRILRLYGYSVSDLVALSEKLGPRFVLGRDVIGNTKKFRSIPSLVHLHALATVLHLTIGACCRIFNLELDKLLSFDDQLNTSRTRIIESYPFYRDRKIRVPESMRIEAPTERNSYIWESVDSWQEVPIRAIDTPAWCQKPCFYAKLGVYDDMALPKIPPGAFLQCLFVRGREAVTQDPARYYFIQHGRGYLCSRCYVENGNLHLLPGGNNYHGPTRFRLGSEAQILGRVSAFFAMVPTSPILYSSITTQDIVAPILSPWRQHSLHNLIMMERMRLGLSIRQFHELGEHIRSLLGYGISGRLVREIQDSERLPHTHTILALVVMCSLRFQDVLRSEGLSLDDNGRHSLDTVLRARKKSDLPITSLTVDLPYPTHISSHWIREWNEWPPLLSMLNPGLAGEQFDLLCLNQSKSYRGLDPLLSSGSILLIREMQAIQAQRFLPDGSNHGWERPIYLVRAHNQLLCSYLHAEENFLTLVPHELASDTRRIRVPRHEIELVGDIAGVLAHAS